MSVIASADWLNGIKTALDSVQSAGEASEAGAIAAQHLDDAQSAVNAGGFSSWQATAASDMSHYAADIITKSAQFLGGDQSRSVAGSSAWAALYSAIFTAYSYVQIVDGQIADGEDDSGLWAGVVVPMAESLGEAVLGAPKVIGEAVVSTAGYVGSTVADAASAAVAPLKWWIAAAAGVAILGLLVYVRSK